MGLYYITLQKLAILHSTLRSLTYWLEYFVWSLFSLKKLANLPDNAKKVLIVNYGAIGDSFVSSRIAYNLKNTYPGIKFYFLPFSEHVKSLAFLEAVCDFEIISNEDIKNHNFDISLLFSFPKSLLKSNKNLGFCVGNEYSSIRESIARIGIMKLNRKVTPRRHKVQQEIAICKAAGLPIRELKNIPPIKNNKISSIINKKKLDRFAVIHPCGRNFSSLIKNGKVPAMAWPEDRFAQVSDYLFNMGFKVIFTGSSEESFIIERIIKKSKFRKNTINLAGKLDLKELTCLISRSNILFSVDTSVVHIAELTGTPCVVLFGPTFYEETGAYGNPQKQVNLCHPEKCIRDRKKGEAHDKENICMLSINTEEVKNAINKVLK